jgi:D-beta-D-heptose 7-phosphate kinase/D-beta-D-heptose 1-phosphate adenosyltransferase
MNTLSPARLARFLAAAPSLRLVVVGDVMLDTFLWGSVSRISPEAPVPVVDFERESSMPGGAANVARNLSALGARAELVSVVGQDPAADRLADLLATERVDCQGLVRDPDRRTSIKTRVIAQQQQVVRVDRESRGELSSTTAERLLAEARRRLDGAAALIVGDYGKGVVSQRLLDALKGLCRARGIWLSLDPKPVHQLDLSGLSLITPNRKEAFELAQVPDGQRASDPLRDPHLQRVIERLLERLRPALLLITLGEQGMLLCQRGRPPFRIPTVAQEVFDVSGAGDTAIASFTLAVAAGAAPIEAAIFSNHAAGVVVGKIGTAVVLPNELRASFKDRAVSPAA